jgi:hypothetical protein
MRNQYFGDERDYHKYSLLLDLAVGYSQLTNVIMLTPDDSTGEGRKRNYPAGERPDLHEFLQTSSGVGALRTFFRGRGFSYHHYDRPFTLDRERYFSAISSGWLRDAVVFLDPDTGMEDNRAYARRSGPTKYVFYDEVAALWSRMKDSCLVVYQHLVLCHA